MGVNRDGFATPSSDSKYSSARLTPSQSNRRTSSSTPAADRAEALPVVQIHELTPVQVRVLEHGGLLAPLRVVVPELLADVRQFEPRIHQDSPPVAGLDQRPQVPVALGVRLEEMPCGHVQRRDARLAPALREVVQVDPQRGRSSRRTPTAAATETAAPGPGRRARAADTGTAHSRARPGGSATHSTAPAPRRRPATSGAPLQRSRAKTSAPGGHLEARHLQRLLPHDRQFGRVHVRDAAHPDLFLPAAESEQFRHRGFAFHDQNGAVLHPSRPFGGTQRARRQHEHRDCAAVRACSSPWPTGSAATLPASPRAP